MIDQPSQELKSTPTVRVTPDSEGHIPAALRPLTAFERLGMTAAAAKSGDAVERIERVDQTSDLCVDLGLRRHRCLQHTHDCGRALRLK